MKKYICSICGYVYDEAAGIPEEGISPGTKWEELSDDWVCPMCGAPKTVFEEEESDVNAAQGKEAGADRNTEEVRKLSFAEMGALCSNLSKGCEKQYRVEEADLFNRLSEYFGNKSGITEHKGFEDLSELIQQDLNSGYSTANDSALNNGDRGALRALAWGEKVTKILKTVLMRYEKNQNALLEDTNVHVCEICGFVYIGNEAPEVCPVCKVPNMKILRVQRR